MEDVAKALEMIRRKIARVGGPSKFCKRYSIAESSLNNVLAGRRPPYKELLDVIGMERVTVVRYKLRPRKPKKAPEGDYGTIYGEFDA
jgi:DNA-binding transcriptional regulator YdaS (Cro superfamily)